MNLKKTISCTTIIMADIRENVLLSLKPMLKDDNLNECIPHIFSIIDQLQLFTLQKTSLLDDIIGHVNKCLGSAKNRTTGLLLLRQLLEQCPTSVFTQRVHTWLDLLLQALQGHHGAETLQLACQVLNLVLDAVVQFPELSRHVATEVISKLVPALLSNSPEWREAAFGSLCCLVIHFGGSSGQLRGKIKTAVLEEMKQTSPCKSAIRCYGLLPRCGSAGNRGVNHETMFEELCQETLNTLHSILSHLYHGFESGDAPSLGEKDKEVSHPDSFAAQCHLTRQFENFCLCLKALLSEAGRYPMTLCVSGILSVVFRCLEVKGDTLMRKVSTERLLLLSLLPSLHKAALGVLSQLLTCCPGGLFHMASSIWDLVVDGLIWTRPSVQSYGTTAPFHRLREALYRLAAQWLGAMKEGSGLKAATLANLALEIQHDIRPVPDSIAKANGQETEGPPRKKRKGQGLMLLDMSSQRKINHAANGSTVIQALATLSALVKAVGSSSLQDFLLTVCGTLVQVVGTVQSKLWHPPLPYGVAACRLALYDALLAFTLFPVECRTVSTSSLYHHLQAGFKDHDPQVMLFCQDALTVVEGLLHPRQPPSHHRTARKGTIPDTHKKSLPRANELAWSNMAPAQGLGTDRTDLSTLLDQSMGSETVTHPSSNGEACIQTTGQAAPTPTVLSMEGVKCDGDIREVGDKAVEEENRDNYSKSGTPGVKAANAGSQGEQGDKDLDDEMEDDKLKMDLWKSVRQSTHQLRDDNDSPSGSPQADVPMEDLPSTSQTTESPIPESSLQTLAKPTPSGDSSGPADEEADPDVNAMLQDFLDTEPDVQ